MYSTGDGQLNVEENNNGQSAATVKTEDVDSDNKPTEFVKVEATCNDSEKDRINFEGHDLIQYPIKEEAIELKFDPSDILINETNMVSDGPQSYQSVKSEKIKMEFCSENDESFSDITPTQISDHIYKEDLPDHVTGTNSKLDPKRDMAAQSELKYQCEKCPFRASTKYSWNRHMLVHKNVSEVEMFKCAICTFETKHKICLTRHMVVHKNDADVQIYECEFCQFQTKHKHCLKTHMVTHKNISTVLMYKCKICTFETKYKHYLNTHMIVHKNISDVPLYRCEICAFQTKHKKCLNRHMVVHKNISEARMYECEFCSFKTKHRNCLKSHMVVHKDISDVRMYKCEKCTFQSKYKNSLIKHVLTHQNVS